MPELSSAEWLLYTTFRLACYAKGKLTSTGTGFFYQIPINDHTFTPLIITNKHVVKGCDKIQATFHEATPDGQRSSGRFIEATIEVTEIIQHPNADVDLCAMGISGLINQSAASRKPILFAPITRQHIPKDDDWQYYDAIEEITMIGCPNGLFDEFNKMPLVRRGITATALSKNYDGASKFLVDMACFPGSSGSPVFLFNRDGFLDRRTNSFMLGQGRMLFVGVLYAGPQITNTGVIVLANPSKVEVASMMHLGYVVKSSAMTELEAAVNARLAP